MSCSKPLLPLAFLALTCLLGCSGLTSTAIGDVLKDPRRFDGKQIMVVGKVKDSANILLVKYFVLEDDTGVITVVTDRSVPAPGDKVRVRGRVNQAFSIGGKSLVVLLEQKT
jgi:hypothetical protein